jgi:hypothetical protein
MLLRLCQLKSLSLLLAWMLILSACSSRKESSLETELLTTFTRNWFGVNPEHALLVKNTEPAPHLLFDTTADFNYGQRTVNTILTVVKGSRHSYAIDLNSGQRYYSHTYCKQQDVWGKFSGSLETPEFSIGHLPRVLDQLGEPQKVIVWSKRNDFGSTVATNYSRVKLVGAYVEQICPMGNCLGKNNWLSRLVFIGVDAEDKTLHGINTIEDFQREFNWDESKALLENIDGRNVIGNMKYPAIRISQLIQYDDAFDFFSKKSIFFDDKELGRIQKSCHKLYDELWTQVGEMRPEDRPVNSLEELKVRIKLREELRKQKKPIGFAARFAAFTKRYFNEVSTCEKFVYHGNFNQAPEKFWFLSHVGLFYRLHREGYYFDCRGKAWNRNVLNDRGQQVYDIKQGINDCREEDIDKAMGYLPNFLSGLKSEQDYFKFIDYDNGAHGTHQRLFSWVKVKGRHYECSGDPNLKIKKEDRPYPEEVRWQERQIKDIEKEMKIIL